LFSSDPHIIAVASDEPVATRLPQLDLNNPGAIAAFIVNFLELR
jgi:molybdopterin-guanine dinucleotide biosynthesis protein B